MIDIGHLPDVAPAHYAARMRALVDMITSCIRSAAGGEGTEVDVLLADRGAIIAETTP